MYKIGIVGSDNSHADAFSKLMNIRDPQTGEYNYPDFRVEAIFGLDPVRTKEVADKGNIPTIVNDPSEMLGMVDAVMVVFRHGDLHLPYALPFIEAGIPTWIDKPFTIKNEDCVKLVEAAKKSGALVTGGSTTKYLPDIQTIKRAVENGSRIGKPLAAVMNFPAELVNEYGGIFFYGHHLCEMCLMAFGYRPLSVSAVETAGMVTAVVKYPTYNVTLNFLGAAHEYYAVVNGDKGAILREIDMGITYKSGFEKFAEMIRTGRQPLAYSELYAAVAMLNAIKESYESGREVAIEIPNL